MALTEQQEKDLLAKVETLTKSLEAVTPVVAEVGTLKTALAEKDKTIADLATKVNATSQEVVKNGLKAKYPDVPEEFLDLPADKLGKLQEKLSSTLKASQAKNDPLSMWADAGSIGPTTEAEETARKAEEAKARAEAAKDGDVGGMLKSRAREIASFLVKSPALSRAK